MLFQVPGCVQKSLPLHPFMQRSSCRVDVAATTAVGETLAGTTLPSPHQSPIWSVSHHPADAHSGYQLRDWGMERACEMPLLICQRRASPLITVCIGIVPRPRGSGGSCRLIDDLAGAHIYYRRWIPAGLPGRPSGRSRPLEIDTLPPGLQGLVVSRGRVGTRGDGGALGKVPRPLGERFRPAASNLRYHTLYL